jgi:hypothetical protein
MREDLVAQMREVKDLTSEIIRRYPQLFNHIAFERIRFVETDSERAPEIAIHGLSQKAISLLDDTTLEDRYVMEVNPCKLEEQSEPVVQWLILECILGISRDCDGRLFKPDFNSYSPIVDAISHYQLGADYLNHPDLPNLLGKQSVDIF